MGKKTVNLSFFLIPFKILNSLFIVKQLKFGTKQVLIERLASKIMTFLFT